MNGRGVFLPRLAAAGAGLVAAGLLARQVPANNHAFTRHDAAAHHVGPHRPGTARPQVEAIGLPVHAWWPWLAGAGVLALVVVAAVWWDRWLGGLAGAGLTLTVTAAVAVGRLPAAGRQWARLVLLAGVGLLLAAALGWRHGRSGSKGTVNRWSRRSRRNAGVASRWQVLRVASRFAVRRGMQVMRPSLASLGWWARLRTPTRQIATPLARVGGLRVWSPIEDVTLRLGGPRSGKSGEMAGRILDAPGAVIATSTRTDLLEITGPCRAKLGPVLVFNPSGLGELASTVTFDPLAGCQDPGTANDRAEDLLAASTSPGAGGDREFWTEQARRVLNALLHAAALGGASMRDVLAWVADPDSAVQEIQTYLRRSPEPAYVSDALQFLGTNDRTRTSICATIMPALGWLTDTTAAVAARVDGGGEVDNLDVARLLAERGTVYMLGGHGPRVAPLVTTLTGHIAREARRLATLAPGGRLDPPLTLALDEAALICPIPLDNWTADMGGRGVTIHIGAQSRAQLRQRWSEDGAAAILNNAATLLIYGGTKDADDLTAHSLLTGERDEEVHTFDESGRRTSSSTRRVPTLSPAQIQQLPAWRVVIIRRGMPPAIGRVRPAWRRHDVRHTRRTERSARRAAALAARLTERTAPMRVWLAARLDEPVVSPVIRPVGAAGPGDSQIDPAPHGAPGEGSGDV